MANKMMNSCYTCKYRKDLTFSAHSTCVHPSLTKKDIFDFSLGLLSGKTDYDMLYNKLGIVADQHGVKNGWFAWPLNFDPVWLENCDGYTPIGGDNDQVHQDQDSKRDVPTGC